MDARNVVPVLMRLLAVLFAAASVGLLVWAWIYEVRYLGG